MIARKWKYGSYVGDIIFIYRNRILSNENSTLLKELNSPCGRFVNTSFHLEAVILI